MVMISDDVDFHLQNNLDQSQKLQTCVHIPTAATHVNVCSLDLKFHLLSGKDREEHVVHILTCCIEI